MSMTIFFQPSRSKRRLTKLTGPWQFTQRLMTSCFTPSRSSGSCEIQSAGVRIGADRAFKAAHLDRFRNRGAFPGQDEQQTEKKCDFGHGILRENHSMNRLS